MGAHERQDAAEVHAGRLTIIVSRVPGEAVTLTLEGELDMASADAVTDEVEAWRGMEPELRLDLSKTSFIDSQGLHVLLAVTSPTAAGSRPVALLAPSEAVIQVIEVTGTAQRLGVAV